jgi:uncharacterized cofD-like protein
MRSFDPQEMGKWLKPGLRVKRWLILLALGMGLLGLGFAQAYVALFRQGEPPLLHILTLGFLPATWRVLVAGTVGGCALAVALYELNTSIVQPIVSGASLSVDALLRRQRLDKGLKVVAVGGGTGLPSVLRGMKQYTSHITAVVTMADDGGSSGRLRREMNVPPPGDLRNNIAALSDDEDLMTRLFQYRFGEGGLEGHSFGNLFLTALSDITGNMEAAVAVAGRVLAITGRVVPSTLHSVNLGADVRLPDGKVQRVEGESNIPKAGGKIERVFLEPPNVPALPEAIRALLEAELIVLGPGSLYTSILPNLMVRGIAEALRASRAQVVYVCNIAQQPGETDDYGVAEHLEALERHVGAGVIEVVLANNHYPEPRRGEPTRYVLPPAPDHPLFKRYRVVLGDLTDEARPWRHDSQKLTQYLLKIHSAWEAERNVKLLSRSA